MTDAPLPEDLIAALRESLPGAAEHSVTAIVAEVPAYRGALAGQRGQRITRAVELALAGFAETAATAQVGGAQMVREGAYLLGRDEARSGRSMDALLAAYRVGARVAWQHLAAVASARADAALVARFAGMVFAYIDELSAASARGHRDELTDVEVERQRRLEQVAHRILVADSIDAVRAAADRAQWPEPSSVTALLTPADAVAAVRPRLPLGTLQADDYTCETMTEPGVAILLAPDVSRTQLLAQVSGTSVVVGPTRSLAAGHESALRAESVRRLLGFSATACDAEAHLVPVVVNADAEALRDLKASCLSGLDELTPATRQRLQETLRSWLLHQGRREAVAAHLFVHPQTVRYRVGQLRELLGERLEDPSWCEAAIVALAGGSR